MTGSYSLNARCTNCTWKGRVVINRGLLVVRVCCPRCDVRGALKPHPRPLFSNLWSSERDAWT